MKKEMTSEKVERILKKHIDKKVSEAINSNMRMLNLLNLDFADFVNLNRRTRRR